MRFSNPADILSGTPLTKMNHYVERSSNTCFNGKESWFGTSLCSTELNEFQDLGRKESRQLPLGKSTMSWKGKGSSPKSHFSEGKLQVFGGITQPKIYRLLVGGFNPFEKYARQIGSFPQGSGMKIPKIFELPPPIGYLYIYIDPLPI